MPSVEELLAGRSDLSTFLVHFTRAQGEATGRDVLLKILHERLLKASHVHGIAKNLVESDSVPLEVRDDVRNRLAVVCMSEVPVDYWSMLAPRSRPVLALRAVRPGIHENWAGVGPSIRFGT